MEYNEIYLLMSSDTYLVNEISISKSWNLVGWNYVLLKEYSNHEIFFNRDILGSILCKYRTLMAKSQVFTSVSWRESEPVTQSNEGENAFMLE